MIVKKIHLSSANFQRFGTWGWYYQHSILLKHGADQVVISLGPVYTWPSDEMLFQTQNYKVKVVSVFSLRNRLIPPEFIEFKLAK